jgi:UDP-N-acetylmuramoyl-tripeptide--D-alanyl-D-alanine ligase
MLWTLRDIAEAAGGRLKDADPAAEVRGLSIDTRTLEDGQMFVAIRAGRDGHDFIEAAGGAAVVVDERWDSARAGGPPRVVVADGGAALLALGRAARRRLSVPVVGITGSVGKTSTKDMAAAALAAGLRTVASPLSFNNELGLPLTLANAPDDAEVVVLEMGARGPGHIALLCGVAEPTIGVVTAVAAAHTEMFGDLEAVARAKGELVESLPPTGTAVLNGDDRRVRAMASRMAATGTTLLYSTDRGGPPADVRAEDVTLDGELRPSFRMASPWGAVDVRLEARGAHQVGNALAALSVAALAGLDLAGAAGALERAPLSPMRMELSRTGRGATILNDAYNANPASMAAALRALAAVPADRRVAVLGPMAELGDGSGDEHAAVAGLARDLGIEVVAVGTEYYGVAPLGGPDEVVAALGVLDDRTAVLVKASRVAALERVATRLLEQ